jgi:acyl-coenzyme A synthetase/AMP-(fatty) acid ligase
MTNVAPPQSLIAAFLDHAARTPHALAIIAGVEAATYRRLERESAAAAQAFLAAGFRRGQVIGALTRRMPPVLQVVTVLGLARAGLTQLLLDGSAREPGLDGLVCAAGDVAPPGLPCVRTEPGWLPETLGPRPPPPDPDLPWTIGRTSGTTGEPKSFLITHRQEAARMVLHAPELQIRPEDRVTTLTGLSYLIGIGCALRTLACGATLVALPQDLEPLKQLRALQFHGVTYAWASPIHLRQLIDVAGDEREHLPRLRVLRVGGSALSPWLLGQSSRRLTSNIHTSYGTNEAGGLTAATPAMLRRQPDGVGRLFEGIEAELRDEAGHPVPAGSPGRLWVRSPANIDGYARAAPEEMARFRDGWFDTGDLVQIDAEGMVRLLGRVDEMLNFDGILISPREIELGFEGHPMVREVAAFAIPSRVRQDLPSIAVVPGPGFDAAQLIAHGRARLGRRAPVAVLPVQALPRNPAGKVQRFRLTQIVRSQPELVVLGTQEQS